MRKVVCLLCFLLTVLFSISAFAESTTATQSNAVKRWVLINIPARSLRVYDNDKCIAMYPVGVGKIVSTTPSGYFSVVEKIVNPTWTDPSDTSVVIPSGPDNPLGYRWIGIGGNYGIHGTNRPTSVGHYVSNGCVRMVEENVEKVFDMVEVGTEVQIIYNRLVIDKTFDNRIAYYIYPDGYNMQNLTVDFVQKGLAGYGVGDFVTAEDIQKAIDASSGQPNYVASPVNIFANGSKLGFKAVNYQNLIYLPVKDVANQLHAEVKYENNMATTAKGSANINYFNNNAYMRLTDLNKLFDFNFELNKDVTAVTLVPITAPVQTETTPVVKETTKVEKAKTEVKTEKAIAKNAKEVPVKGDNTIGKTKLK